MITVIALVIGVLGGLLSEYIGGSTGDIIWTATLLSVKALI